EKYIWTDADFDGMGWHDCWIHAFTADSDPWAPRFDFVFDLDYLVRWVIPESSTGEIYFWVAPATLAFHCAREIRVDLYAESAWNLQISELRRIETRLTPDGISMDTHWEVQTIQGTISLWATGFTQYIRRPPV